VPLFIQNLLAYSTTVVAVGFVGHLNQPELLSAAVLANSLYNVTGYSLLQGLASGMESLCGQVRWQLPVPTVPVGPCCAHRHTHVWARSIERRSSKAGTLAGVALHSVG
jgi:hypothetical protein